MKELADKGLIGRTIPFIVFILISGFISAQVNINLNNNPVCNNFTFTDLWNIQFVNSSGAAQTVYLSVEIVSGEENNDKEFLTAKSNVFILQPGTTGTGAHDLSAIYDYKDPLFVKASASGTFPPGNYYVCYILKSVQNETEISRTCTFIKIKGSDSKVKKFLNKKVEFTGRAESELFYDYRNVNSQNVAPAYFRFSIYPSIKIFDLPFFASLTLNTTDGLNPASIRKSSMSFNYDPFVNTIKQKAYDYLNEPPAIEVKPDFSRQIQEQLSIGHIMQNPKVTEELENLKDLNRLDKILNDSNFINIGKLKNTEIIARLSQYKDFSGITGKFSDTLQYFEAYCDSLKSRYLKYEYLKKKEKGYLALMQKKQKLDSLMAKVNSPDFDKNSLISNANSLKENEYRNMTSNTTEKMEFYKHKLWLIYDKYFFILKDFSLGTFLPVYSNLTLSGLSVNGVNITLQPGKLYFRFTKGKMNFDSNIDNTFGYDYQRSIIAGAIGYTVKDQSFFRIHVLSTEDETGDKADNSLLHRKFTPVSNKVVSLLCHVELLKKKIIFEGELAGSHTIGNNSTNLAGEFYIDSLPYSNNESSLTWIKDIFLQNTNVMGIAVDYAFKTEVSGSFFKDKTRIALSAGRTGPRYFSAGVSYMNSDRFNLEASLVQSVRKQSIKMNIFCKYNHDNLNHYKLFTTTNLNTGGNLSLRFKKLPSINIGLLHILLYNSLIRNNSFVLSTIVAQRFKTGKLNHYTSFTSIMQYNSNNITKDLVIGNFILNHLLTISKNLSLHSSVSCNISYNSDSIKDQVIGSLAISTSLWKVTNNTLGAKIFNSHERMNYGFFFETNINVNKYLSFRLNINNNLINNYLYEGSTYNANDLMVRGSLFFRW